ncbi:unnamed protein product [Microthlaspi erraticum]|uniref:Peptidyl-prolyl cis-trans isomerase n=1 Tax=Microthlaspi erraticum TaxID=1685480 RepID=A0A6D2IHL7_9BRAS|nr:unnamed protein product [Microthlaspi erraticum]
MDVLTSIMEGLSISSSSNYIPEVMIADCGLVPPAGRDGGRLDVNVHPKLSLKMANPRVFFDMTVGGRPAGRIVMELFADTTPKTAENFRALCTGEKGLGRRFGKPLHYKGSIIHELRRGYIFHGGDITAGDGSGGESIYEDRYFDDENFIKNPTGPGVLSMVSHERDTNESQFMINMTISVIHEHVEFGQVVQGLDVIRSIMEVVPVVTKTSPVVMIANCGQIS